ncbi:MAG: hypothetical protein LUH01_08120 [Parabacteroides gordonii]|nr:hypothetical protein [Parabacteroides gordonii]
MDYYIPRTHKYLRKFAVYSCMLVSTYHLGYGAEHASPESGDTLSFHLPNVIVTAIESKGMESSSLLPSSAIEHVQPFSAADLMQLLPGGLTGNPGFNQAQYFTIREITLTNGLNKTNDAQSEGR